MNKDIYHSLMEMLLSSVEKFSPSNKSLAEELQEDFETIIEDCDITEWKANIDGSVKGVNDLIFDLTSSIKENDRQKCIESIAMLRCAIADIASAFSNAMDSMENLVVTVRDENPN